VTADVLARSPLQDRAADLARFGAGLVPFLSQVDLRVDPSHAELAPYPLPLETNTAWHDRHHSVLWLGPDEWLVLSSGGSADEVARELSTAFDGVHHSVVDVSANRVAFALTGDDRFDLLSHVCSIDLDPRVWGQGRCAQTLLGRAQVVLFERNGTTPILVRSSFADYVVDLLLAVRDGMDDVGR
jgi:sarcosine oxidase, subunit gamma